MALNITKSSEPITVTAVKILIYGQPGAGKTSTAFTAGNVLTLDTDNGAYRSAFRKDIVQVSSWDDIRSITPADIESYDAVCIDTVGRLLDWMTVAMIKDNPKMGNGAGGPSQNGWGKLKNDFAAWVKTITSTGKHLIMLAHHKDVVEGDETHVRPDIQGGSLSEVFKIADAAGFIFRDAQNQRVLDFSPTKGLGKNVANLPPIVVPDFTQQPEFLADVIKDIMEALNTMSEEGKQVAETVTALKEGIDKILTAEELNQWRSDIIEMEHPTVKKLASQLLVKRSKALPVVFDKDADKFVEVEVETPADLQEAS